MGQNHVPLWDDLAGVLATQRQTAEALAALDRQLAEHPDDVLSWRKKGYLQATLQRYDEALQTYEHALSLDAANAWTWMSYANMLDKL